MSIIIQKAVKHIFLSSLPRLYFLLSAIIALRATYLRAYYLRAYKALHLSRVLYKSHLFMQNKANFRKARMKLSFYLTRDYENIANWTLGENKPNSKPIKPNTNPKQTQLTKSQNELNLLFNKGL